MDRFSNDKRVCLSTLNIDSGTVRDDSYSFAYHNPTASVHRYSQDFFGYLNGETGMTSLNPIQCFEDFFSPTLQHRHFSLDHAKTFALSQINQNNVFTKLSYEANRYDSAGFLGNINIGLRIKSIETWNGATRIKQRIFDYEDAQSTINFSNVSKSFYVSRKLDVLMASMIVPSYKLTISAMEGYVAPGAAPENARICYGKVTETITDGTEQFANQKRVKTEYIYDCEPDKNKWVSTKGQLNDRTWVTENRPGLSQRYYSAMCGDSGYVYEIEGYFKHRPQFFNNLIEQRVYRTDAAGQYTLASKTINKYCR